MIKRATGATGREDLALLSDITPTKVKSGTIRIEGGFGWRGENELVELD